jgi:hypothetical protein
MPIMMGEQSDFFTLQDQFAQVKIQLMWACSKIDCTFSGLSLYGTCLHLWTCGSSGALVGTSNRASLTRIAEVTFFILFSTSHITISSAS